MIGGRTIMIVAILATILAVVSFFSFNKTELSKTDMVFVVSSNISSLDPHNSLNIVDSYPQGAIFEGLYGFDLNNKIVPVLAESMPTISTDNKTYTVKLKKNVTFSNGEEFNAEAVKINFDRMRDENKRLRIYRHVKVIEDVITVDDYTVQFKLLSVYSPFINSLANSSALMINPKSITDDVDISKGSAFGTGAFKFDKWLGNDLTVVKNEDYRIIGQPKVNSITFKPSTEESTRINMLKSGEAHLVIPISLDSLANLQKDSRISIDEFYTLKTNYVSINTQKKPFDDLRVRQAIAMSIDTSAYNNLLLKGTGDIMDSILAKSVEFYAPQSVYKFNPEKAKDLLIEAGYKNGLDVTIWGNNGTDTIRTMEFIKQQLAQSNIRATIVPMESSVIDSKIQDVNSPHSSEVQLYVSSWTPGTGEPNGILSSTLSGSSLPPKGFNAANYDNPVVNALLDRAIATPNEIERASIYNTIQAIIVRDAPWVPLVTGRMMVGRVNELKGIKIVPTNFIIDYGNIEYTDITIK